MSELKRTAAAGVRWAAFSMASSTALQLGQVATLARLLDADAFGLVATVTIIVGFVESFTDMGLSAAIIQRQNATRDELSTLYWLNLLTGVAATAVFLAATPLVVALFDEPRVATLAPYMSLLFVIAPIGAQFHVLLQKQLAFRTLAAVEIGAQVAGVGTAIATAIAGQGALSLVWGTLATAATRAAILAMIGWRRWPPRLRFRWSDTQGYLGFGLYQIGQRAVTHFNNRAEHFVLGVVLGTEALGLYTVAFTMIVIPAVRINDVLGRVALPVFARVQHDLPRLRRGYFTLVSLIALVAVPILLGAGAAAPSLVVVALGDQWVAVVPLVPVLAVVAALRALTHPIGPVLLARGRADMGFRWNLGIAFTQFPAVLLGSSIAGLPGVVATLAIMQGLYTSLAFTWLARALLGPCVREVVREVGPPCAIAAVAASGIAVIGLTGTAGPGLLAAQVAAGVVVQVALVIAFQRERARELVRLATGSE